MIYTLTCLGLASMFATIAWRTIHTIPWNDSLIGHSFAYGAVGFWFMCAGLGEIARIIDAIRRRRLAESGLDARLPNYHPIDGAQPTV